MERILIVEDDRDIADLLRLYLEKAGYGVDLAFTGQDIIDRVRREPPDLIVLDLMLPGIDGLTICRALREDRSTAGIPIIILSARADESDRIRGLELGADDYVTKPFSPKEVVARVVAVQRRTRPRGSEEAVVRYGRLTIDHGRHVILDGDTEVSLTAKEFLLLDYFVRYRGRVLSRERLLSDVWGYNYAGGTRTVDVHIRRLRKKLPQLALTLATVHQFGYKLLDLSGEPAPSGPLGV